VKLKQVLKAGTGKEKVLVRMQFVSYLSY